MPTRCLSTSDSVRQERPFVFYIKHAMRFCGFSHAEGIPHVRFISVLQTLSHKFTTSSLNSRPVSRWLANAVVSRALQKLLLPQKNENPTWKTSHVTSCRRCKGFLAFTGQTVIFRGGKASSSHSNTLRETLNSGIFLFHTAGSTSLQPLQYLWTQHSHDPPAAE